MGAVKAKQILLHPFSPQPRLILLRKTRVLPGIIPTEGLRHPRNPLFHDRLTLHIRDRTPQVPAFETAQIPGNSPGPLAVLGRIRVFCWILGGLKFGRHRGWNVAVLALGGG